MSVIPWNLNLTFETEFLKKTETCPLVTLFLKKNIRKIRNPFNKF